MPTLVKPRRRYDSSARQAQANRTRSAVLIAAHLIFLERGFADTTMPMIAVAAGVSSQTIYKLFGNKSMLAKAVFDVAIAGDEDPVPPKRRSALQLVQKEKDAHRKLELYGRFLAEVAPRHVPLQLVVRDAARIDPDARAVWAELQTERLRGMTLFARGLRDGGHLRAGISVSEARDVLWTYNSAEVFQLLVMGRGWSPTRYGRWVADALIAALL